MSYKINNINGQYEPICISFEKDTKIISTIVKHENKRLFNVSEKDYIENNGIYEFRIPDKYQNYDYLVVERVIIEYGHQHWISLNWKSLTPIEGIDYTVNCSDGIIKEYYIFDDINYYDKPELSNDRKSLTFKSSKWLDPNTGLNIIIAEPLEEDDFNDALTNKILENKTNKFNNRKRNNHTKKR